MKGKNRISVAVVLLLLACVPLIAGSSPEKAEKVAEGEYLIRGAEEKYEIRELWTLWRHRDGRYLLSGEVKFSEVDPASEPRNLHYELSLSDGLKPLDIRLWYAEMEGASIVFEFGNNELRYRAERKGLSRPEETTLPISAPYALYPGFSSWQLGLLCREAKAAQHQPASVRLVFVDDPPPEPIGLHPFEANVEYVAEEEVEVDGRKFKAGKFLIQGERPESGADAFPRLTVWVLREGLLVAAKADDRSQVGVELVRYKKYAEFGVGK